MITTHSLINGRYRIIRAIGSGGMGSVFAARDERLGRDVAIKILRPDLAADPRARARFLREAQIAAQLVHPHVVRTYDVGDAPEGPYLVQELLQGQTLDALMPLPPERARVIAAAVADALSYIHERGYVHCDIKPQNIMLTGDPQTPRVVLLDFGIARVEGTDTTTLIATPQYLAPERATGDPPTAASDLYALGIMLYQMVSGRPPFDATSIHAILQQHRVAPLPPLPTNDAQVRRLWPIIEKLTAKRPADRYASAAALRHDLEQAARNDLHAQPTIPVTPPALVSPPEAHRRSAPPPITQAPAGNSSGRYWLLALPLLGLLLLGAIVTRGGATPTTGEAPVEAAPESPPTIELRTVPPVAGVSLAEARQAIENAGFIFVEGERVSSEQPPDTVIATVPAAAELAPPGSEVVAQISAGPPPTAIAPPPADDDDDEKQRAEPPKKERGKGKGRGKDK